MINTDYDPKAIDKLNATMGHIIIEKTQGKVKTELHGNVEIDKKKGSEALREIRNQMNGVSK